MRLIVKLGLSFFFITLVLLAMSGMSIKNISAMNKRLADSTCKCNTLKVE